MHFLGNRIEEHLNKMKKEQQCDEKYIVNGYLIFDESKEDLQKIFSDFPNQKKLVDLVVRIKGNSSFYCFILQSYMFILFRK